MGVPAVSQRGKHTIIEPQQRAVGAFGRSIAVPRPGDGPDAHRTAAGKQTHDVDLMGGLAEYRATSGGGIELLRTTGAIEEVRVVESLNHPYGTQFTTLNDIARTQIRRIEAVTVADEQVYSGPAARLDH